MRHQGYLVPAKTIAKRSPSHALEALFEAISSFWFEFSFFKPYISLCLHCHPESVQHLETYRKGFWTTLLLFFMQCMIQLLTFPLSDLLNYCSFFHLHHEMNSWMEPQSGLFSPEPLTPLIFSAPWSYIQFWWDLMDALSQISATLNKRSR